MRRYRNAKIVATLGPASSSPEVIRELFRVGADVFRLNFSHGTHDQHRKTHEIIRGLEREIGRPIAVLLDLQGPKLRVGTFSKGPVNLTPGARFRLDLSPEPGDQDRVSLPHPEIFAALKPDAELLLNDGKLRLKVERCGAEFAETRVLVGGGLSERKGVNVPGVILPISPLTKKDREDMEFGLGLGVEWLALSFVQQPKDLKEARTLVAGRAPIMTKLEKPSAVEQLDEIIDLSDAVMVARGDLGVELPPEHVPGIQKRVVRACRRVGKPVVVATQMLESMIEAPTPTRAEASDVATAIYDGVDAVMLSAESAAGKYPTQAVTMMDRIISQVERDPQYRAGLEASHTPAESTTADAICCALRRVTGLLSVPATITYTSSGFTSMRAARERPRAPIVSLTPNIATARRLSLVWGVHSVQTKEVGTVDEMVEVACKTAMNDEFAKPGDEIVIVAGMPFVASGNTNLLRIARIDSKVG
ncbi:MAG: pyruvate kinase [Burkholderiales bacterium]